MRTLGFAAMLAMLFASPSVAQSVRSTVTASNGVVVTIDSDAFAARYEYSAPTVRAEGSFVLVSRVREGAMIAPIRVVGGVVYSGEWRFYERAIFQGGAPAPFRSDGRNVESCSGARYGGGCSFTESFSLDITPAQLREHAANGNIAVQIRARDGHTLLFIIPLSYFAAINEVSQR